MESVVGKVEFHYFQYKYGQIPEAECVVKDILTNEYVICLLESDGEPEEFNKIHQKEYMYNFEGGKYTLDDGMWDTLSYNTQDYVRDKSLTINTLFFVKKWNRANEVEDMFMF